MTISIITKDKGYTFLEVSEFVVTSTKGLNAEPLTEFGEQGFRFTENEEEKHDTLFD